MVVIIFVYGCRCYECDSCANIYVYICDVSDLYLFPINRVSKMCNFFQSNER